MTLSRVSLVKNRNGLHVSGGGDNILVGSFIGVYLNEDGVFGPSPVAEPNTNAGVLLDGGTRGNSIGKEGRDRNDISFNGRYGIDVAGSPGNSIYNNRIYYNGPEGGEGAGIWVHGNSPNNVVGGAVPLGEDGNPDGAANYVSANNGHGVKVEGRLAPNTLVLGNHI